MKYPTNAGQIIALILIAALAPVQAGVGGQQARYIAGPWQDLKEDTECKVYLESESLVLMHKGKTFAVPYKQIKSIEYGQKAGRRVGATVALGITTLGLGALPVLFSKKRKHFATVTFADQSGQTQGLLLEFGKDINRKAVKMMSIKSGVEVEFESDEAKKDFSH